MGSPGRRPSRVRGPRKEVLHMYRSTCREHKFLNDVPHVSWGESELHCTQILRNIYDNINYKYSLYIYTTGKPSK